MHNEMKISELYQTKQNQGNPSKKTLSFEIFPPKKDSELKNIDKTLAVLCELNPDYISVTFGAGGGANRNRTIELAKRIKQEYHVEPVVHLTCLHYDKAEIDDAITEILITTDENRRQELYTYVLTHLHEDAVYIPLTYECNKAIYRSDMKGFHFTQTQYEVPFQDFSF